MKIDQNKSFFSTKKSRSFTRVSVLLTFLILIAIFVLLYFVRLYVITPKSEELNLDFVSAIQGETKMSVASPDKATPTPATVPQTSVSTPKKQENVQKTTQTDVATQKTPSEVVATEEKTKEAPPEPVPTKAKYVFSDEETEPVEEKTTQTVAAKKLITQGSATQGLGIEGELKGRGLAYVPNLNSTCLEKGIVVIDVTVNASGEVIRKIANYKQSTTTASCLIQEALSLTQKIQWEPHHLEVMSGSVQFNFQ